MSRFWSTSFWMDVLVVCSSAGWTDQKHMLYLSLLQESFVNQLHDGEISFKGLFNLSPRACRPKQSSKRSAKNTEAGQGYLGVAEVDRAKSWIKVEQIRSPCCQDMEDGEVHCMGDDDASTTEPVQESSSQASATSSGQSSTSHFGKRRHSQCRTAEGSDQNFIDGVTEGIGELRRRCSKRRLKSANHTMDEQMFSSMKDRPTAIAALMQRENAAGDRGGSSDVDQRRLPDAEPGSSSCNGHGPKG